VLLACPGLVYRRDRIDRLSVGEPHQLDLCAEVTPRRRSCGMGLHPTPTTDDPYGEVVEELDAIPTSVSYPDLAADAALPRSGTWSQMSVQIPSPL